MKIFKTLSKRGLALFLVLTMCVSLLPATALAAEAAEALHTHNEDGWACVEESQLICGYEQEHTHDETCWAASEETLACSLEEAEGHQHDESCYTEETTLACGQEESEEHSHDETCYVTETVLSCGQDEAEGHAHGEDCFAAGETVLTCELEEHQHGEECYASVWTCTEPSEDVSRFLRAVKAIPEEITAENVEEAEVRIAEAIVAYQHLGGAEKSNASVVRAYDAILAAEIAVEAAKNEAPEETPEIVLPEDAVVIDPAVLVEYTGVEEEEVAVADLFTFVANTYLVDEEDPDVVTLPASLYFVGENVEERFDIMDILFPAESEDELPEEPETVALTADSIVYQDVPVTAYFLPEETVAQEELLMEMGNDEVELLDTSSSDAYYYILTNPALQGTEDQNAYYFAGKGTYSGAATSNPADGLELPQVGERQTFTGGRYYEGDHPDKTVENYQTFPNVLIDGVEYQYKGYSSQQELPTYSVRWYKASNQNDGFSINNIKPPVWFTLGWNTWHVDGLAIPNDHATVTFKLVTNQSEQYVKQDGSLSDEPWVRYYDLSKNVSATFADVVQPSNPTPELGYIFDGWYTNRDCTIKAGDSTPLSSGEQTFYGRYVPEKTYTVTYDLAGGTSTEQLVYPKLTNGDKTPIIADPTKTGYMFAGWDPAVAATVSGDATYTAQWDVDAIGPDGGPDGIADKYQVTVTFVVEHGYWNEGTDNAENIVKVLTLYKDGELSEEGAASLTAPAVGSKPATGYMAGSWDTTVPTTVNKAGDNSTYTYEYVNAYTVTYDLADGTSTTEQLVYTNLANGAETPTIADPTKTGYVFAGWDPAVAATVSGDATYTAQWDVDAIGPDGGPDGIADKYQVTVTFVVEHGYWNEGTDNAENIVKVLTLYKDGELSEEGAASLTAPAVGSKPATGYMAGSWDTTVPTTVNKAGDNSTYTYEYVNAYTVTYDLADGTSTTEQLVYTNLANGAETPTIADPTKTGYVFAGWDPAVAATVSGDATYTAQWDVDAIGPDGGPDGIADKYQVTVTFAVEHGYWDEGTDNAENIVKVLTLYKDGELSEEGAASLTAPAVGSKPATGYMAGSWDTTVPTTVNKAGDNSTYTYEYVNAYTVTYDLADGTSTTEQLVYTNLANGAETPTIADPTKTGYVFAGWDPAVAATVSGDATYTAQWDVDAIGPDGGPDGIADKYQVTVTFVVEHGYWNEGTDNAENIVKVLTLYKDGELSEEGAASLTAPAVGSKPATGYMAGSWDTTVPTTVNKAGDNSTYTYEYVNAYTVTYDLADGTSTTEQLVYTNLANGAETPTIADPTKTGYVFAGWDPAVAATVSGDATYTAQWDVDAIGPDGGPDGIADKYQVTVTFAVEHGYWDEGTDNAENIVKVLTLYKDGELSEEGAASLTAPAVGSKPATGYMAGSWDTTVPTTVNKAGDNSTYTYEYVNAYTVTYDLADGTSTTEQLVYTNLANGAETPTIADPTKTGYVFAGWDPAVAATVSGDATYTAQWDVDAIGPDGGPDGIADKYQVTVTFVVEHGYWNEGTDNAENIVKVLTLYKDGELSEEGAASLTAPAVGSKPATGYMAGSWDTTVPTTVNKAGDNSTYTYEYVNAYTVTYDLADGTSTTEQLVYTNLANGAETPTIADPTKTGYVFAGWDPAVAATVSGDATYTAQWDVDAIGPDGGPDGIADKYQVTVTFVVEHGYWNEGTDNAENIVKVLTLYKDGELSEEGAASLTAPAVGSKPATGYMAGSWDTTVPTTVNKAGDNSTYTYEYVNAYTVTYDLADGTSTTEQLVYTNLANGAETPTIADPTKTGYVFAGWDPAVAATVSGDATYTAQWDVDAIGPDGGPDGIADKYQVTVTFAVEHGYWDEGTDNAENIVKVLTLYKDGELSEEGAASLTAPAVGSKPATGYMAGSWDTTVPTTVNKAGDNSTYTYEYVNAYTVTYDLADGTSTTEQLVYTNLANGAATPTIVEPTKTGYVFAGWDPVVAETVSGNATYTAQWDVDAIGPDGSPDGIPDKYQVTFEFKAEANGVLAERTPAKLVKTLTDSDGKYVPSGTASIVDADNVKAQANTGYEFDKWTSRDFSDQSWTSNPLTTENLSVAGGKTYTFTATFKSLDFKVVLDPNEGGWPDDLDMKKYEKQDDGTASKSMEANDSINADYPTPEKEGYKFIGWKVNDAGENNPLFNFPMPIVKLWEAVGKPDNNTITLTAQWEAKKLTYTTVQHFRTTRDENVEDVHTITLKGDMNIAVYGTPIADLITGLETAQSYDGQQYAYVEGETKPALSKDPTLTVNGTQIDLYYYLDTWKDNNNGPDSDKEPDGTPDVDQVLIRYEVVPADGGTLSVVTQVETLDSNGKVTAENEVTPNSGYEFVYWTSEVIKGTSLAAGKPALNHEFEATGGSEYTFTAMLRRELTATAKDVTVYYDGQPHGINVEVTGAEKYTVKYYKDAEHTQEISSDPVNVADSGTIYFVVTAEDSQYDSRTAEGSAKVTINPVALTATAKEQTKVYDGEVFDADDLQAEWYTITAQDAAVIGEAAAENATEFIKGLDVNASITSNCIDAKTYQNAIAFAGIDTQLGGNYTLTQAPADLVITPKPVYVTVTGKTDTVTYNGEEQTVTGYDLVVKDGEGDDAADVLDIPFKNVTAETTGTNVGTYDMGLKATDFMLESKNYTIAGIKVTDGWLNVEPKEVTVTANNQTKAFGEADPELTATVSGTIDEDTVTYTLTREPGEAVGSYAITPAGDELQGNYTVSYVPGTLTIVNSNDLEVRANNVTVVYDGESHKVTAEAIINGAAISGAAITVTYKDANGNVVTDPVNAGTYTAVIMATLAGYETADASATVTITPRPVEITVRDLRNQTYTGSPIGYNGTAHTTDLNDKIDLTKGDLVAGDAITSIILSGRQTIVGTYNDELTASDAIITRNGVDVTANYRVSYVAGTLNIIANIPPVIPPVTPPPGGGGGTTIPDGPTPLVPDPGTTIADQDVPLAAPGLNNTDHFDYIKGYVIDGQILVRPEANITRAEVATIFFRLMTKEFREANWATENDFTDVKKGDWYNNAISTCTKAGILKGYEDGTFKPNQTISREEFAAIAARFASEEVPAGGMFKDIAGRWSEKDIERAAAMGWIKGSNGLFRPVDKITRAEVIVIVNRMLDRVPDADHMLPDMKTFADNTPDMWWYADVQEATNSHEYDRAEDGVTGIWTSLLPEQDWAALEEEWATAADANVADVAPKLGAEGEKPEEGAKEPETAGGSDGNGEE